VRGGGLALSQALSYCGKKDRVCILAKSSLYITSDAGKLSMHEIILQVISRIRSSGFHSVISSIMFSRTVDVTTPASSSLSPPSPSSSPHRATSEAHSRKSPYPSPAPGPRPRPRPAPHPHPHCHTRRFTLTLRRIQGSELPVHPIRARSRSPITIQHGFRRWEMIILPRLVFLRWRERRRGRGSHVPRFRLSWCLRPVVVRGERSPA